MGCEIEIKAHISSDIVDSVRNKLLSYPGAVFLGFEEKEDFYWIKGDDQSSLFRIRREESSGGSRILVTSKPLKSKDECIEFNEENEFTINSDQLDNLERFVKGLGYSICRIKYKKGFHYSLEIDGFTLHCEVLEVKYLGWFVETEICGDDMKSVDTVGAENALRCLLDYLLISKSDIEPRGYSKLLKEIGHEMG